jgi:WhiB family redox-sensing transcriptional regulator
VLVLRDGGGGVSDLTELFVHADWHKQALCRGATSKWYSNRAETTAEAKATCRECPVQEPCLEWALTTRERYGIFGGLSERERRKVRRERGIVAQPGKTERWLSPAKVEQVRLQADAMFRAGTPSVYPTLAERHGLSRQIVREMVLGQSYPDYPGPIRKATKTGKAKAA